MTTTTLFHKIRLYLYAYQLENEVLFDEEAELDESYFGAQRVRGKHNRGAAGKTPVF
jgi:transposase